MLGVVVSWLEETKKIAKCQVGVYRICNTVNDKIYIGISFDLRKRLREHYYTLTKNRHGNKHLQSSVNKYGIDKFLFEIVEILSKNIDKKQLLIKEHKYQTLYKTTDQNFGYNIKVTSSDGSIEHPEEYKFYMSRIMTGKKATATDARRNRKPEKCISDIMRGKVRTAEHGKKISEANRGKPSRRAIKVIDKNGNVYNNIGEASRALGISRTTVEKRIKNGSLERYT